MDDMDVQALRAEVEQRLNTGQSMKEIAEVLQTNRHALSRKLKEDPAWYGVTLKVPMEECVRIMQEVIPFDEDGGVWGIRRCWVYLWSQNYRLPRDQVGEGLRKISPEMLEVRRPGRLHRQVFTVRDPMVLWSIDSWGKLVYF
eukprot:TRINITY_DN8242_c0_g1_i1.p1 TRINITY_DN8242_c0_g1~~TRINITY_DN8242_c0_g1_i1.p1  ORF type:complete len:143 (-),score=20.35 TRINITY_DN8242_c0_g1_i1:5-433(-)